MAATVEIHEMTALTTGIDKSGGTVRFKDANDQDVDANDPLQVPSEGTNYSYTKKLRAYMEDAPEVQVNNLRWYTDGGGFGTDIGVTVKNLGNTWSANYKTQQSGGSDFFGYTEASPLDGDATNAGPFDPDDLESYIGDLIELQMSVGSGAAHGALDPETITLAFDEI